MLFFSFQTSRICALRGQTSDSQSAARRRKTGIGGKEKGKETMVPDRNNGGRKGKERAA